MNDLHELICKRFNVNGCIHAPYKSLDKTRNDLALFFGELGFKSGAEIGVFRARYSRILCGFIPGLSIKCVDPWPRKNCEWRLRRFDAEIIKKTSMEAVREIPDNFLDFVYIDANHEFDFVMSDIIFWSDKVRSGGIVSGHDYQPPQWGNGVKTAVYAYTREHNIDKWYLTCEESVKDNNPSWFWVKP